MSTVQNKANTGQKWILAALLVLFALPFSLSWFLFNFTDFGKGEGKASHGELIVPPRLLPDVQLVDATGPSNEPARLYGKWSLVYLLDGECGEDCEQNLYRMRQLRLAMGKHAHRVQRVLINYGEAPVQLSRIQMREYRRQYLINAAAHADLDSPEIFALSSDDRPLAANRLYIVDPRGFLMMSYAPGTAPGGIIEDLKRLLRYSSIG